MNELSCKTVSDLVAASACRVPIIAPTVPRVVSIRNPRRDIAFDGAGPAILFSPWRRVVEKPRHRSNVCCISPNGRPANFCNYHRSLPVPYPKNYSAHVHRHELLLKELVHLHLHQDVIPQTRACRLLVGEYLLGAMSGGSERVCGQRGARLTRRRVSRASCSRKICSSSRASTSLIA